MNKKPIVTTEGYRGTRDFYPSEMAKLRYIFDVWSRVSKRYGFEEYLAPLLENWDLYAAKNVSGEEIVNEQLYWFEDRGGRKVAIRPEMTPSVSRMVAGRLQELIKPVRWYSIANFMRYEKPQRGRVREFFQLNVDLFGDDSILADAEIIEIAAAIMREFNATSEMYAIYVNNRKWMDFWVSKVLSYKGEVSKLNRLIDRLPKQSESENAAQLSQLGLSTKQVDMVLQLPFMSISDVAKYQRESEGARELVGLFEVVDKRSIGDIVSFNCSIMRGLDYYTGMVFEQFDLNPENKRSMCGGGRYEGLVSMFGKDNLTAVGFAPGDVTTLNFLEGWNLLPQISTNAPILVSVFNSSLQGESWMLAQILRQSGLDVELYTKDGISISDQLKYANKKGFRYVLILGEDELAKGEVLVKDMVLGKQNSVVASELPSLLKNS
ncbi:histidine--tRNA ligase [candidate division WWE3 bacterium]|nr:histidine--tRNA ligase [candidate division WWE3 bacterium]